MNLLIDPWLPVVRKDGTKEKIAIHQLLHDYHENPVLDLEAPRPDFRNALYQLLIGIVQVTAMPEDEEEWVELFKDPYDDKTFTEKVLKYQECFEIDSDGPAFMQDYDLLNEQEEKPIFGLLMGAPGKNTIDFNKDFFIKNMQEFVLNPYWAAICLFVLQTVGPPDGGGHREGLSGSGAMNTVILPIWLNRSTTLWETIWTNIFPTEHVKSWNGNIDRPIFPWVVPTKSSSKDRITTFNDLNPLSVYWSFPRRIRFRFEDRHDACSLTRTTSDKLVTKFKTLKHGTLYHNTWQSPFVSYSKDGPAEDGKKKNSMRALSSNFNYSVWCSVALNSDDKDSEYNSSKIVNYFLSRRQNILKNITALEYKLWVFGYHMKPGEATVINWNEAKWPFYPLPMEIGRDCYLFSSMVAKATHEFEDCLIYSIKQAWYRPRIVNGKENWKRVVDPKKFRDNVASLSSALWHNTEQSFYSILDRFITNFKDIKYRASLVDEWGRVLKKQTVQLYDQYALAQQEDGLDMKRVIKARSGLHKSIKRALHKLQTLKEVEGE